MTQRTKWHRRSEDYQKKSREHALAQGRSSQTSDTSNSEFAKNSGKFKQACENADIKPTSRQASKFRSKKGLAYATLGG